MTSSPFSTIVLPKNHAAGTEYGPKRERQMWKTSVVKARQGPQLFSSPTIFGDDVIIHKKIEKEKCVCASGSTRAKARGEGGSGGREASVREQRRDEDIDKY